MSRHLAMTAEQKASLAARGQMCRRVGYDRHAHRKHLRIQRRKRRLGYWWSVNRYLTVIKERFPMRPLYPQWMYELVPCFALKGGAT